MEPGKAGARSRGGASFRQLDGNGPQAADIPNDVETVGSIKLFSRRVSHGSRGAAGYFRYRRTVIVSGVFARHRESPLLPLPNVLAERQHYSPPALYSTFLQISSSLASGHMPTVFVKQMQSERGRRKNEWRTQVGAKGDRRPTLVFVGGQSPPSPGSNLVGEPSELRSQAGAKGDWRTRFRWGQSPASRPELGAGIRVLSRPRREPSIARR